LFVCKTNPEFSLDDRRTSPACEKPVLLSGPLGGQVDSTAVHREDGQVAAVQTYQSQGGVKVAVSQHQQQEQQLEDVCAARVELNKGARSSFYSTGLGSVTFKTFSFRKGGPPKAGVNTKPSRKRSFRRSSNTFTNLETSFNSQGLLQTSGGDLDQDLEGSPAKRWRGVYASRDQCSLKESAGNSSI
jgi:hypothetical protein